MLNILVLALAAWRLTELVQYERGPWAIFTRLRKRLGVTHDEDGKPISWPDTELGRLARCVYCGSVWTATGLVGLHILAPLLAFYLALPFALSAAAILIAEVRSWLEHH